MDRRPKIVLVKYRILEHDDKRSLSINQTQNIGLVSLNIRTTFLGCVVFCILILNISAQIFGLVLLSGANGKWYQFISSQKEFRDVIWCSSGGAVRPLAWADV